MNIYFVRFSTILIATVISHSAFAEDHIIVQKDKAFYLETPNGSLKPAQKLNIQQGDNVIFKNEDKISHNVYSKDGANEFEIPKQAPKSEKSVAFDAVGQMSVRCAIHPRMKLNISVQK